MAAGPSNEISSMNAATIRLLSNGVIVHGRCHNAYANERVKESKSRPGVEAFLLPGHDLLTPGRKCEHCHKPLIPVRRCR